MIKVLTWMLGSFFLMSCKKTGTHGPGTSVYASDSTVMLSTDKAVYKPGETVTFNIDKDAPSGARVRYRQLSTVVAETDVTGKSWQWTAPAKDFTGYMVDIYEPAEGGDRIYGSIAVDVSSDWDVFPGMGSSPGLAI